MAIAQNVEKAPGSRLLLLTSLLALAVVSAAAFGRVFQGDRPTVQLMLAAAVAVLLAGLVERQHVLVATLLSAVGLAVAVGLLVFPQTTRWNLPTVATWRAVRHAWASVGRTANTEVAPALPLRPLFLAGLTAVWAASFSAHSLAARARSPFLALLPPAGLLAFTSIILQEGGRPLYVLVFLSAAMAVLFADGLRRVGQWGPVTMWQDRRRLRFGTRGTLRGARWVAITCLIVAVFLPGILPGYRQPGLVEVHGGGGALHVSIDPIVDIRPQLLLQSPIPLFTVRSSVPSYWRFMTLDVFNGRQWIASNLDASGGQSLERGALTTSPDLSPEPSATRIVRQHFDFERLAQRWLPAAPTPIEVAADGTVRYDPESSALVVPDGARTGYAYDVTSRLIVPTPQALRKVGTEAGPEVARYLQLPGDTPSEIFALAHQIAGGRTTPYDQALAVQSYLRSRFVYDERAAPGHGIDDILHFLQTKRGYCEQFAGTMAVMLRALGVPARVAVGFTPGEPEGSDLWKVSTTQAHAWVEVLFPKYGWLPFEPTPTRYNQVAASFDFPFTPTGTGGPGGSRGTSTCPPFAVPRSGQPAVDGRECATGSTGPVLGGGGRVDDPGTTTDPGSTSPAAPPRVAWKAWLGIGLVSLLVLLLVGLPASKLIRRRVAVRRAREPGERILVAYRLLADQAADVGLGRRAHETLWEYRARLRTHVSGLDGEFDRLTGLAGRAAYSDRKISPEQARLAAEAARRAARQIRETAPIARRLAGWFRFDRTFLLRWAAG